MSSDELVVQNSPLKISLKTTFPQNFVVDERSITSFSSAPPPKSFDQVICGSGSCPELQTTTHAHCEQATKLVVAFVLGSEAL